MPTQVGSVEELILGRDLGKLVLKPPGAATSDFLLYDDTEVEMIDPTEMVKRNWMIAMLQQAFLHRLDVSISHPSETDATVTYVAFITPPAPKKPLPATAVTKGTVKEIELFPDAGYVEMDGNTVVFGEPSFGGVFGHHRFLIYGNGAAGLVDGEDSNRRNRVVGLLRQALADGLEVSVTHRLEPGAVFKEVALIYRVTLHAKE